MSKGNAVSYKVADSLYLVKQTIAAKSAAPATPVEVPTDHLMIYDCSGSMSWDLPKIREQVKKKLPKMLKDTDTFSAIWFSGRGECGILLEKEPVATLKDLQAVEKAVDRWLRPVGLTGFKEPLELAVKLADKLGGPGRAVSATFMSDGCDNQWNRADILKVTEALGPKVQSTTFVEYGYYADRPLLTQMAEKAGGSLIFAEDFDRYEPAMAAVINKRPTGAKRIEVDVPGDPIGGFAYALSGGDLVTFSATSGKIAVPEDLAEVFYLSNSVIGTTSKETLGTLAKLHSDYLNGERTKPSGAHVVSPAVDAAYAAISLFAVRMKPEIVFPFLKAVGDVTYIEQFANCFGKQKYSEFMEVTKNAAFNEALRVTKGYDPNKIPREDAFTVMNVLYLLQGDENARVLLDDPRFKYSKIGRGRVDATDQLSDDERAEVVKLTTEMTQTKDAKKVKELAAKIAAISDKPTALKFVGKPMPNGYPFMKLTFNEDRPNISFLTKREGTVDLSARLMSLSGGPDLASKIPATFETFVYRNYTVVKDGLVNIETLPVHISDSTFDVLKAEGVVSDGKVVGKVDDVNIVEVSLNLKALPVVNRKMVKTASAKTFFEAEYELSKAQAAQKVFNAYVDEHVGKRASEGYAAKYGADGAKWLQEQGITDFNGFQPPKTTQAAATDFYMGKELKVSLKGLSTLPKVAEVKTKMASNGKLNAGGILMKPAIEKVETFMKSDAYTKAKDQKEALKTFLEAEKKAATEKVRAIMFQIAQTTFTTVVGQVWFSEFSSIEEGEMTIKVDGQEIACKAEMLETKILL